MIKIPINKIKGLLECLRGEVITIAIDEPLTSLISYSPLCLLITRDGDNSYSIYLIETIGYRVIGSGVDVYRGMDTKSLYFYMNGREFVHSTSCGDDFVGIYEFLDDLLANLDIDDLSPYESWVLEFLAKREALLSLYCHSSSLLMNTNFMGKYLLQAQEEVNALLKEVKSLIENYPHA